MVTIVCVSLCLSVCLWVSLSGDAFLHNCTLYFNVTLGNIWVYPLVVHFEINVKFVHRFLFYGNIQAGKYTLQRCSRRTRNVSECLYSLWFTNYIRSVLAYAFALFNEVWSARVQSLVHDKRCTRSVALSGRRRPTLYMTNILLPYRIVAITDSVGLLANVDFRSVRSVVGTHRFVVTRNTQRGSKVFSEVEHTDPHRAALILLQRPHYHRR